VITLEHLSAGYGGADVLKDVSFTLDKGELLGIIGPNGSGKSTILRVMIGMIKATGGTAAVDGHSIEEMKDSERAKLISYLPQNRNVPELTVKELVSHGRYPRMSGIRRQNAEDRRIVHEVLERIGMQCFADRMMNTLSGGERQWAYLGMLLAQGCPYMLLDEPNAFLDPARQFEMMELLKTLCSEGFAAAAVLHDLPLAFTFCSRILVLDHGRTATVGSPQEILQSGVLRTVFGIEILELPEGFILRPAK